ncbi:MAG: DUF1015 domain-containing protein [Actinomycetaceae bacterium]|nr:DUF1015 domain-containing protein [Actinomycetaceae bacterium]
MTISAAFIDLPRTDNLRAWCVIAADQYSSSPQYWQQVADQVGSAPSTLHLMVPEVYLSEGPQKVAERVAKVHETMDRYRTEVLETFGPAAVYVRRSTPYAKRRDSLIVALDLDAYSFTGEPADVQASEATVLERLPAREAVRAAASLELPHVQVLFDDPQGQVFSLLEAAQPQLPKLYETQLMQDGGSVAGWRVDGDSELWAKVSQALNDLPREPRGFGFIVGDGNHSLAAARSHWLHLKEAGAPSDHPARWALVELLNIHDPGLRVEPIHRWVGTVSAADFEAAAARHRQSHQQAPATEVQILASTGGEVSHAQVQVATPHPLLVKSLDEIIADLVQSFDLDPGADVEYVHGEDDLAELVARRGGVGMVLPALSRSSLFDYVATHGAMPKKSFSLGEACEKRYYCECRRLVAD